MVGGALVVLGAVLHAVWNLLVKRSLTSGPEFVWLYSALVTPALALLLLTRGPEGGHWEAAVASAALHTLYAVVLQRAYALGELGVVYPVARAGAPVLVALGAVPLLSATVPRGLWVAVALVAAGVLLLAGARPSSSRSALTGVAAGGCTAVTVAAYTLWDGYAIGALHVDVLTYLAVGSLAQLAVLTLVVAPRWRRAAVAARTGWRLALPVAVLVPTSYGLVLLALERVDVQVVAAARSAGVLAASALGWVLLGEPRSPRHLAGALVLAAGVALAALSG